MATDAKVIIIGAGIIGGSIAWRLAQAGAAVTLLDAGTFGAEASWAGAGMLAPGGEFAQRSQWAEFALASLAMYPAFVEELRSETGLPIDYRTCGEIEIARNDSEWQELRARRATQQEAGIRSEFTERGLFYPDEAVVDPRQVMDALRRACEQRGVEIREQTRAIAVRTADGQTEVETTSGKLTGSAAVLAAGAWAGEIPVHGPHGRIETPVSFPVRGYLFGFSLPPGSMGPVLRHGHTYVTQRSNGYTIAGTSSEQVGFNREIDAQVIADIRARVFDLVPELRAAGEPEIWLGFRPATPGFEPAISRLPDVPVWLAYGHYRNGILMAPATAARIAKEITSSWGKG
ncbi:MAG TPA: FAD-dependent oxidoreductase [Bryobacteraceae bacterium]|nr:FAD-dependent oxidoreductase [Bryobacteraceae bacterium]